MSPEYLAILFGLASAASWGAGDFSGGFASKRNNPLTVVLFSQITGLGILLVVQLITREALPPPRDLLLAGGAGMLGTTGLVRFYRELSGGRMGIIAPLTSLVTAALPVLFSILTQGLPQPAQLAGFGLGLLAVFLISRSQGDLRLRRRDVPVILFMGATFGTFFIVIGTVSQNAVLWPLMASRSASILMVTGLFLFTSRRPSAAAGQWRLMLLIGLLDVGGSGLYALATSVGRLDVAAVLASLYPAVTVLLARFVLDERLSAGQWAGVGAALAAIALIAI
jgi:drug/metabolite transporter (DMT)-like permease